MMQNTMQVPWSLAAIFSVLILMGMTGCTPSAVPPNSQGGNPPQPPGTFVSGNPLTNVTPQPNLPSEIRAFRPPDGSQACPTPQVVVDLRLTDAMRKNGSFDLSTVTLMLDGKDVTQETQVLGTMVFPQDQVSLSYAPKVALNLGTHRVSFTYPSGSGRSTLVWTFTVANVPCP